MAAADSDAPSPLLPPLVPASYASPYLAVEGLCLFGGFPAVLFVFRASLSHLIIPLLLLFAGGCGLLLWADRSFPASTVWGALPSGAPLRRVLRRLVVGGGLLTGGMALWAPELLGAFVQNRPVIWALLMVVYPLLSVYPQELLFRAFLFHRYAAILPSEPAKIVVSAGAFGWAHVVFGNWTAPVLSMAGGLLFALTYTRTGSLRLAAVEHALWGGLIFSVGLGRYFYSGAIPS